MFQRLRVRVAVMSATLTLLTSCTGQDGASQTPSDVATMFTKDSSRWVLPLDSFAQMLVATQQEATDWLIRDCMVTAGYPDFPVPVSSPDRPAGTRNGWERRLFDQQIAQTYGYTEDWGVDTAATVFRIQQVDAISAVAGDTLLSCGSAAVEHVGSEQDEANVRSLGAPAYESSLVDDDVLAAAALWRQCMATQGVPDLPDTPKGMPSDWVVDHYGLSMSPESGTGYPPPSADQIALAVADARCRESSGYTRTLYDTEWDLQLQIVADNLDALERQKQANVDYAAKLDRIIAEHRG